MSKIPAYTKSAKLRAKKAAAAKALGLPELAQTPQREKNGQYSRAGKVRDAAGETMRVRCRHMGKIATRANLREASAPWWGCRAGRAAADIAGSDSEMADLWDAICHMRKVIVAYDAAIGAPRRHAVCMRLLVPTEPMEADASDPAPDERTGEEKQRDATSSLMRLETWLGYTDKASAGQAKRSVWDDEWVSDPEGLVSALRCVVDGMKGRKMRYRCR